MKDIAVLPTGYAARRVVAAAPARALPDEANGLHQRAGLLPDDTGVPDEVTKKTF